MLPCDQHRSRECVVDVFRQARSGPFPPTQCDDRTNLRRPAHSRSPLPPSFPVGGVHDGHPGGSCRAWTMPSWCPRLISTSSSTKPLLRKAARSTFNPHFDRLVDTIIEFLETVDASAARLPRSDGVPDSTLRQARHPLQGSMQETYIGVRSAVLPADAVVDGTPP